MQKIMLIQIKERYLNRNNQTPLQIASLNNSDKIKKLLISKGAE